MEGKNETRPGEIEETCGECVARLARLKNRQQGRRQTPWSRSARRHGDRLHEEEPGQAVRHRRHGRPRDQTPLGGRCQLTGPARKGRGGEPSQQETARIRPSLAKTASKV